MTKNYLRKRYNTVGSFLRPDSVKEARDKHLNEVLTDQELRKIEDEAIERIVDKQLELGYTDITDGELRRSWWHLDFYWGLDGVEPAYTGEAERNFGENSRLLKHHADNISFTGKISGANHPFVEDFKYVHQLVQNKAPAKARARITIPSPARLFYDVVDSRKTIDEVKSFYPDKEAFKQAIIETYLTVIDDLYQAGARSIQLDDPIWITLVDQDRFQKIFDFYPGDKEALKQELAADYVELNNAVQANQPADLEFSTHNCRGNFRSKWASEGGYDAIADQAFGQQVFDVQYLEYDSERSGSFEALQEFPEGVDVVLGLITSKTPELEDKEVIKARIEEASAYIPLENLYLSPQCGFASTEEGNLLTEEEQWRKLELVKEIADEVWPDAENVQ